ncbi:MAG TPA: LLM class flavin-dependent oxidoreductase [Methylomirabilota bacterium]|nr:LLM class flavin-dependent oxidoreductase [Methylomirabilota bacterium]
MLKPMHFGLFVEEARPGTTQAAAFQEGLELAEAAEAWGVDCLWLGELHFNPARSVISAPLLLAAFIAGRTRRLRVGTAVQLLPLNNPLRIAEEVATVDHLSEGRFNFGIGRSGSPVAYDVLGVPYDESQARFLEALAILREAWKGQRFSYQGQFYRFENAMVSPRPYQLPHPPLRMAANSPETFASVGRLGLPLFVGVRDLDLPALRGHLRDYRRAWQEAGHPEPASVYLRIPVYAGTTEKGAREEPKESITYFFQRHADLIRSRIGRPGSGPAERHAAQAEHVAKMSYDEILKTRVVFGTAAGLIERLAELRDDLELDGILVELNAGGLIPKEQALRTLRILSEEVMPALK